MVVLPVPGFPTKIYHKTRSSLCRRLTRPLERNHNSISQREAISKVVVLGEKKLTDKRCVDMPEYRFH